MLLFFDFGKMVSFCKNGSQDAFNVRFTSLLTSITIFGVSSLSVAEAKIFPYFPQSIALFLNDDETVSGYLFADVDFINDPIDKKGDQISSISLKDKNIDIIANNI